LYVSVSTSHPWNRIPQADVLSPDAEPAPLELDLADDQPPGHRRAAPVLDLPDGVSDADRPGLADDADGAGDITAEDWVRGYDRPISKR
jgi:hypothetical protein